MAYTLRVEAGVGSAPIDAGGEVVASTVGTDQVRRLG